MAIEAADGPPVAEETTGFARFGVAADVGDDSFVQAVEQDFNAVGAVAIALGRAKYVGGKEVAKLADVEVVLTQVARCDSNKTLLVRVGSFVHSAASPSAGGSVPQAS